MHSTVHIFQDKIHYSKQKEDSNILQTCFKKHIIKCFYNDAYFCVYMSQNKNFCLETHQFSHFSLSLVSLSLYYFILLFFLFSQFELELYRCTAIQSSHQNYECMAFSCHSIKIVCVSLNYIFSLLTIRELLFNLILCCTKIILVILLFLLV